MAVNGTPQAQNDLKPCHWPDGCHEPITFVWLRESFGSYGNETTGLPVRWQLSSFDARTGSQLPGVEIGPQTTGSAMFRNATDLG